MTIACVVCTDERAEKFVELLTDTKLFTKIYILKHQCEWLDINTNGTKARYSIPNEKLVDKKVAISFVHTGNEHLWLNSGLTTDLLIWFNAPGNPPQKEQGQRLFKETDLNNFEVTQADIRTAHAYATGKEEKLPKIFRDPKLLCHFDIGTKEAWKDEQKRIFSIVKKEPEFVRENAAAKPHRYIGGLKPIVYVLDDYSNYVENQDGIFHPKADISLEVAKYYLSDRTDIEDKLKYFREEALTGFCQNLNSLSIAYEVICEPFTEAAWTDEKPSYRFVSQLLPFGQTTDNRDRIAAFLVDFEWLPPELKEGGTKKVWETMGYYAIHLLAQKYPEIPSFLFTGIRGLTALEEGLSYGAAWAFYKQSTHHKNPETVGELLENLDYIRFEHHLTETARKRYGAYKDVPFPDQFHIDPHTSIGQKLIEKLKLDESNLQGCPEFEKLQVLIAMLFPHSDRVTPTKILTQGKSGTDATIFVKPKEGATRFVKVSSWLSIQREYAAYQRIIQPRLNSYIANAIHKPVLSEIPNDLPKGAIAYSLAGFPEDYGQLRSLHDIIKQSLDKPNGAAFVITRLEATFEKVLQPLHLCTGQTETRSIWDWLWHELPPKTGELTPLADLGSMDFTNLAKGELLSGWELLEVECDRDQAKGKVWLRNPATKERVKLSGNAEDIQQRFGASWVRPLMPVQVVVEMDKTSKALEKTTENLKKAIASVTRENQLPQSLSLPKQLLEYFSEEICQSTFTLPDPFYYFSEIDRLPQQIQARAGAIHGDLNLNNILFAGDGEQVGWLIDFERSLPQGMVAFDFAKLEVSIWNDFLSPALMELARSLAPDDREATLKLHFKLFELAFRAAGSDYAAETFETQLAIRSEFAKFHPVLLLPVANLFKILSALRQIAAKHYELSAQELHWSISVYAFNAAKFSDLKPWGSIGSFLLSAWYLAESRWKYVALVGGTIGAGTITN